MHSGKELAFFDFGCCSFDRENGAGTPEYIFPGLQLDFLVPTKTSSDATFAIDLKSMLLKSRAPCTTSTPTELLPLRLINLSLPRFNDRASGVFLLKQKKFFS
jgi:hypothetical protein